MFETNVLQYFEVSINYIAEKAHSIDREMTTLEKFTMLALISETNTCWIF
jgi:hypothetical protein